MSSASASKTRVGSVDVLKFLLALAILLLHAGQTFGGDTYHMQMGGVAVEAFFVISGCLMCMSAEKDAQHSERTLGEDTASFLWRKVKGLLVPYIVTVVIYLACWFPTSGASVYAESGGTGLFTRVLDFVPDVLLVFMAGILQNEALVKATWYISAMLIAMLVTYPLVRHFGKNYTLIVAPLVALLLMGFIYNNGGGSYKGTTEYLVFLPWGLFRAFIGINLGCVAYELSQRLRSLDVTVFSKVLLTIAAVLLCVISFWVMEYGSERSCYSLVLLMPFLVGILFSQQMAGDALFNNAFCYYLGKASTYIYLYHAAIRKYLTSFNIELTYQQAVIVLFVGSFAMFVVTDLIERLLCWIFAGHSIKVSRLFVHQHDEVTEAAAPAEALLAPGEPTDELASPSESDVSAEKAVA